MSKITTSWRRKGRSTPTVDYDAPTVDYDGSTTPYAGNGETHNSVIKQTSSWSKRVKKLTNFLINPAADTNEYLYNSSQTYNSAATYSGIVVGEPHSTAKKPQAWSKA